MGAFTSRPGTKPSPGRLEAGDYSLQEVFGLNGKGLELLTAAIWASNEKIAEPGNIVSAFKHHTGKDIELSSLPQRKQNQILASLVRDIWVKKGWIFAYEELVNTMPNISLHPRLLEDVKIAVDIYSRILSGEQKKKSTDLKIHIGSELKYDTVDWVGPKSAGGNAWKSSKE
jgi:hypothetical protein